MLLFRALWHELVLKWMDDNYVDRCDGLSRFLLSSICKPDFNVFSFKTAIFFSTLLEDLSSAVGLHN